MTATLRLTALVVLVGCTPASTAAPVLAPAPVVAPTPQQADTTPKSPPPGAGALSLPNADPFPSTYKAFPARTTVIRNATIMTAAGPTIRGGSILLRDGKIAAVGAQVDAPSDAVVVDGTGKFVTPGMIDTHSHLGVYPAPGTEAYSDGNEATNPATPYVWAEHSVWPQDPQFPRARGGRDTIQILPGSAISSAVAAL
ncbi:MAG: hypothetical protein U0163_17950 [Gemmatimonadaceae bacterium]